MAPRPRVLFVFSTNNLYGACRSMLDFVEGLPERGYDPVVALHRRGPLQAHLDAKGIQWIPIYTSSWMGRPKRRWRLVKNRLRDQITGVRVGAIARSQGIDLVHSNTLTSPVGAFIAQRAGLPHVWHMREAADTVPGFGFNYGWDASSRLMNRLTHTVIGNSQYIVDQTARYVERRKLRLLYGGPLDPADADLPLPSREPLRLDRPLRLLLVGKITVRKGQSTAMEALAILRRSGVDARLAFAGDGAEENVAAAKALAANCGVADAIDWLGFVDPKPLYATHDVALIVGPRDPIPRVAIEANAFGIPAVGIRSGGIPEVIVDGETGWLCAENDAVDLAEAIRRAAGSAPEAQAAILRQGHRRAYDRFNWERYRDDGVALYREIGF